MFKVNKAFTAGGRLGVLATSSTLIYGLLGYSWLEPEDVTVSGAGRSLRFALPDAQGWTIGGGFEHKLNQNVSLRGEYRYTEFGKEVLLNDPNIGVITGKSQNHTARLVAAYRFGGSNDVSTDAANTSAAARGWSGFYVGGGIGADAFVRDVFIDVPTAGVQGALTGLGGGGFTGSVVAGYDHMISPMFVAGIFGSFDQSASEFKVSANIGGNAVSAELLSLDSSWTVGARAGVLLSNDVLLYGLAGYTRVSLSNSTFAAGLQSLTLNFPTLDGVTFGAGFEKMISPALSLRAEYRYTALEDATIPVLANIANMTINSSMHSAKLIATYHFNGSDGR